MRLVSPASPQPLPLLAMKLLETPGRLNSSNMLGIAMLATLLQFVACSSHVKESSPVQLDAPLSGPDSIGKSMKKCLNEVFHLENFRGQQEPVIRSILDRKDTFAIMPTGAGKSLCFQLPAVLSEQKVTLVITPLLALMLGQVAKLQESGILAAALYSSQRKFEREKVMNDLFGRISNNAVDSAPLIRLLYVTPELLCTANFQAGLQKLYEQDFLNFFAVDEAHCVSEWGHEFRPSFRRLGMIHARFNGVPWLALTATATEKVKKDVVAILGLRVDQIFRQSFDRPNIRYQARHKELIGPDSAVVEDMAVFISHQPPACSGIVYCHTKSDCDSLALQLADMGLLAKAYHAGLPAKERLATQRAWMAGDCKVVCATIAFGMGIDKPDVRFVIHYSCPKSLEAYYQETGRAGRDGLPSEALLYACRADIDLHRWLVFKSAEEGHIQPQRQQAMLEALSSVWTYARGSTTFDDLSFEAPKSDSEDDSFLNKGTGLNSDELAAVKEAMEDKDSEESEGEFKLASSLIGNEKEDVDGKRAEDAGKGEAGTWKAGRVEADSTDEVGLKQAVVMGLGGGAECRRVQVLRHFGELVQAGAKQGRGARCCDVCCGGGLALRAEKMVAMQSMHAERARTRVYYQAPGGGGEMSLQVALKLKRGAKMLEEEEAQKAATVGNEEANERQSGANSQGGSDESRGKVSRMRNEGSNDQSGAQLGVAEDRRQAKKARARPEATADSGKKRAKATPLPVGQTLMTAWCTVKPAG